MIYLDNAATTKPFQCVLDTYSKASMSDYFNPSALYTHGTIKDLQIRKIQEYILDVIDGQGEIVFNSGGTEGVNHVFNGVVIPKKSTILISAAEHDCVFRSAKNLEMQGHILKYIPVDQSGKVIEEEYIKLLGKDVSLISVMHVCNETGAVNDISRLDRLARSANKKVIFHSDGVQAFMKIKVSMRELDVDFYTISAHKFHGIKGSGFLYKKKDTSLKPLILGGGQQNGYRSGTVSFPAIAALYTAIESNLNGCDEQSEMLNMNSENVKEYAFLMRKEITKEISDVVILSPEDTCGILLVAFKGIKGEVLLHMLDKKGIMVATGSACSGKNESLYKRNLKLAKEYKDGIVRFSFSKTNYIKEIPEVIKVLKESVNKLREV